jgi:predicted metal-binding membrane protein
MFWAQARPGHRTLTVALAGPAVAAWLAIITWSASPFAHYLHHGRAEGLPVGAPAAAAIFVGGWTLMVVAMMLPTTYPVVALYRGVIGRRDDRGVLLSLCLAGYVVVWVAFGAVAYVADIGLHEVVERVAWLDRRPWVVGAAVLALAGAYQFTSLKYTCLERCRTPRLLVLRHWTGRRARLGSLALGLDSGLSCVGCCWSLMLLMLAVGAGSVPWMLLLATLMAIEKNVAWGRRISRPLGASLLGTAALAVALSVT